MGKNGYLMEGPQEAIRLDVKTDGAVVETQACWAGIQPGMRVADLGCGAGKTTHHLKKLVQPGGHADGDADILRVALRETHEETGIPAEAIRLVDGSIFDVDIHTIPPMHGDPRHIHFDIRFLVEIDDSLPVPGNDESHDVIWVPLYHVSRYNNNLSTWRMVEKTRQMRLHQH